MPDEYTIEVGEVFPRLKRAPIVEAILECRASAETEVDRDGVPAMLKTRLPAYATIQKVDALCVELGLKPPPGPQVARTEVDPDRSGFRLRSEDPPRIVQLLRGTFVFSWLAPYAGWQSFRDEALRLWQVHQEIANPSEVQRMGLRYINRLSLPSGDLDLGRRLLGMPGAPEELPLPITGFLHRDTFSVPGYPYGLNIVCTLQPPNSTNTEVGIIVDIDVFTTEPLGCREEDLRPPLEEMRILKNRAFFGRITAELQEKLR